ncbi:MAG TPA: asparagine synthase (glutamine-hydrolyzing) [Vicinamibacterales bacterium]|nr:asparagine synthase (glutamine-hydrolyzing) [Vicinamibacterales bacterium]
MCGICGELRFDGRVPREPDLVAMRERLHHRGPDSAGLYVSPSGHAGLAYRRLSIIDLSSNGDQPMGNEDGSVQLVFNGEIYNFRDLRQECSTRGHRFRSQSDSEVILHLYEDHGPECVSALEGMFALAIWDERRQQLTLARDRAGEKPLFYMHVGRVLVFASEMKALFAHPDLVLELDPDAVPYYFVFGYVPGPATVYKRVMQVEPGTLVTIDAVGGARTKRYWQLEYPPESEVRPIRRDEAARGVSDRLRHAVKQRLVSDVPLGAFLSGGLDSSIIVGLMSQLTPTPVKTFSIGFEGVPAYDETAHARVVAKRFATDHTEFRVQPSAIELIDTLIWHHDGPFGDSSAVPTFIVSRLTRQHVTVVLTGDGGDELFAGYLRFYASLLAERVPRAAGRAAHAVLSALPARSSERHPLARAQRFFESADLPPDERLVKWNALFFDLDALLCQDFAATLPPLDRLRSLKPIQDRMDRRSILSRALLANFTSYLPDDLLVKADRCTMANSLEARAPFLDRELMEYVAALPDEYKMRGRETKSILREAFADLLPRPIRERGKMGFGVPLADWFRGELRDYVRDLLLDPNARYRGMLSRSFVERLVATQLEGRADVGKQLWALISFERWLRILPEWHMK